VTPEVCVIANEPGRFADLGLPVHADILPNHGALGGIYTALVHAGADRVLVVACDLPFLDGALLGELCARAQEADAAWVETPRGPEPLLACYQARAAARVREALDAGHLRARDLARVLDVRVIDEIGLARFGSTDRLLANVNTPDEYERVKYLSE
jgi:molybdopterin-guanine dinucleotide biosynthesis protein A